MKVIILAGGFGSRLAEKTDEIPKPMVCVGERPILWHIMKHYDFYRMNEFYIALGYKGETISKYFECNNGIGGSINTIDTDLKTNTGGRLSRLRSFLGNETFMLAYGDGVSDVNLDSLLAFHRQQGLMATVTAVRPPARFGGLKLDGDKVNVFSEKSQVDVGWINAGYMVLEPAIFNYPMTDDTSFEIDILEQLAREGQLAAFRHEGFWQCMDTLREKRTLDAMWQNGHAPWKIW